MSFLSHYSVLKRFRHLFLAAASGLVLSFALPEPGTWLAAWIGLVPLFIALRGTRPLNAALCGLVAGLVYYGIILHWITLFGFLPWTLLVVYEALYFAVFAALAVRLLPERVGWRGFVAIPSAWVAMQFARTLGAYAFIWGSFAHTQAGNLPIAQIASITGPWGIDFLVCLVNLAVAHALLPQPSRRFLPLIATAAITAIVCLFGIISMQPKVGQSHVSRVAVLQGNMKNDFHPVPNYDSLSYATYSRMTAEAANAGVDLIIWPETAIPSDITSPGWADSLTGTARLSHTQLLVGGYDPSRTLRGSYNSVFLFDRDGRKRGVYHKVQLVPFGEFVPMRDRLPVLANYGIRPEDVLAARTHTLLNTSVGKIGISICFESLFPEIARTETLRGAQILCVVTNDAWFQRTQAAREHLLMSRLRAIENRRYVLRAAGTGISAVIDPCGRVIQECGLFQPGIIYANVQPSSDLTLYTRLGQWFAYLCLIALTLSLALPRRPSKSPLAGKHPRET